MLSTFWIDQDTQEGTVFEEAGMPLEVRACTNDEDYPIEISGVAPSGQRLGLALTPIDCIRVFNKLGPVVVELIG